MLLLKVNLGTHISGAQSAHHIWPWKVKVKVTQIWFVGVLYMVYIHTYICQQFIAPLTWMSQRGVWWWAGFSNVPAVSLSCLYFKPGILKSIIGRIWSTTKDRQTEQTALIRQIADGQTAERPFWSWPVRRERRSVTNGLHITDYYSLNGRIVMSPIIAQNN